MEANDLALTARLGLKKISIRSNRLQGNGIPILHLKRGKKESVLMAIIMTHEWIKILS